MITSKELYNKFVERDVIKPAQQISAHEAINRYKFVNMLYAESFNLYNGTAQNQGLEMNVPAQAKKITNIIYDLIEDALIDAGLQVLSRGVIRQLGFYTNDELLKATFLMHVTQCVNGVSIQEINDIVRETIIENAEAFRVSVITTGPVPQPATPAMELFRKDLQDGFVRPIDQWRMEA